MLNANRLWTSVDLNETLIMRVKKGPNREGDILTNQRRPILPAGWILELTREFFCPCSARRLLLQSPSPSHPTAILFLPINSRVSKSGYVAFLVHNLLRQICFCQQNVLTISYCVNNNRWFIVVTKFTCIKQITYQTSNRTKPHFYHFINVTSFLELYSVS